MVLSENKMPPVICGLLVLICLTIYGQVGRFDFIQLDDKMLVIQNPFISKGLTMEGLQWAWGAGFLFSSPHADYWQPVTFLVRMLLIEAFGLNPAAHHLANLVLHILNVLLVFQVMRRMTGQVARSAMVAALFAIHPLRVESIAWVVEIKDLLCGFFWLLTIWLYLRYVSCPGWRRYLCMLLVFALGLMSKPMMMTLPLILLLLDSWPLHRVSWKLKDRSRWISLFIEKIPLLAFALISALITLKTQHQALQSNPGIPSWAQTFLAYGIYLWKNFVPYSLYPAYPPWNRPLNPIHLFGSAALLIGITIFTFRKRVHQPWLWTGWAWFVLVLAPVVGLGDIAAADRFTYLPSIGLNILLVWGISQAMTAWPAKRIVLPALATVTIALLSILTFHQTSHWQNSFTLFEHTLRQRKDHAVAHLTLGLALAESGNKADAVRHFQQAIAIQEKQNRHDTTHQTAMIHLKEAMGTPDPMYMLAKRNLAYTHAAQGKFDEAIHELSKVMELQPDYAIGHYNLAMMLIHEKRNAEAIPHLEAALRLDPRFQQAQQVLNNLRPRQSIP